MARKRQTACSRRYFAADVLEQATFDYLRKVFRAPEVCAGVLRGIREESARRLEELEQHRNSLSQQRLEAERELSQHNNSSKAGGDTLSVKAAEAELKAIKQELAATEADLQLLRSLQITDRDVLESLENLDEVWEFLQPPLKARIVHLLLDSATVYDGRIKFRLRICGIKSLVDELTQEVEVASNGVEPGGN